MFADVGTDRVSETLRDDVGFNTLLWNRTMLSITAQFGITGARRARFRSRDRPEHFEIVTNTALDQELLVVKGHQISPAIDLASFCKVHNQ
jgi:hypothetical protein